MKFRLSPRAALVIIAAMFLLPLVLAWLMYSGSVEFQPVTTRNKGNLVKPPVPVELTQLESLMPEGRTLDEMDEHWVVLYAVPEHCDETCLDAVTALRQVHRSTGRNQARIRLLLLLHGDDVTRAADSLIAVYPSFFLARDPREQLAAELRRIAQKYSNAQNASGNTYLIDPIGNIMMHYPSGSDPNDLKKDLKRLLTWSKLDEQ